MRILLISSRADRSGGPRHLLNLLTGLRKTNPSSQIWIAMPTNEVLSDSLSLLADGVISIPSRAFSIASLIQIRKLIKKHKIQIIHSHGRGAGYFSRLLYWSGARIVHTFHGVHTERSISGRIKLAIDRLLASLVHHYIFVSDDEQKKGLSLKVAPIQYQSVIPNGVFLGQLKSNRTRAKSEPLILGTFTRDDYAKGVDLLLEHTKALSTSGLNFRLRIYGLVKDKLKSEGPLENQGTTDDPNTALNGFDVYVSTSRFEGLPLSVLEAMAIGLPCVLSTVTGHSQLIADGGAIGFDPYSSQSFVDAINKIASDDLRERTRLQGHDLIRNRFSIDLMVDRISHVYKTQIAKTQESD